MLNRNQSVSSLAIIVCAAALLSSSCMGPAPEPEIATAPEWPEVTGYSEMMVPPDNPMTAAKVALGQQLYYDQRLSGDGEHSCYGCHLEEYGLTDGRPLAIGAFDRTLTRSSPTMWNVGYYAALYWDGRSTALEKQVQGAWSGGNMGASGQNDAPSMEDISAQLNEIPGYQEQFEDVYGEGATPNNVAMSVAAFMRTIVTTTENSRYIRFRNGDTTAFSDQEQRGWEVFSQRAQCTNCHAGLLLTDQQFHNIGIGMDAAEPDLGRFNVTNEDRDRGAFKTPSLFDISQSAPYFHNGSVPTLEEAVDLMLSGGIENEWRDDAMLAATMAADLTDEEKADLLAFLRALDVDYTIEQPMLP